jgi:hypothetical protein
MMLVYKSAVFLGGTVSTSLLRNWAASKSQLATQFPQPMQRLRSTTATLSGIVIASNWHRETHVSQPVHNSGSISA